MISRITLRSAPILSKLILLVLVLLISQVSAEQSFNGSTTPQWINITLNNATIDMHGTNIVPGLFNDTFSNGTGLGNYTGGGTGFSISEQKLKVVESSTSYKSPAITYPTNYSAEFDMNITSAGTNVFLVMLGSSSADQILIKGAAPFINSSAYPTSVALFSLGETRRVRLDVNSTGTDIYINGTFKVRSNKTGQLWFGSSTTDVFIGSFDNIQIWNNTFGNVTFRYNASVGNVTSGYNISVQTLGNANISLVQRNNVTQTTTQVETNNASVNGWINRTLSGTKYQNTDFILTLYGNGTSYPSLREFIFQTGNNGSLASITNNQTSIGNFWINNTWTDPLNADFDHVSFYYANGTWLENVSAGVQYLNKTYSSHYTQNISAQTVDTSGNMNTTKVWFNATIPNNPISISGVSSSYSLTEGQYLLIDANYTDADSDTGTFSDNATEWNVNSSTGIVNWTAVIGSYSWNISVIDGYGSTSIQNFTVQVSSSTFIPPPVINVAETHTLNYFNRTWGAGT